MCGPGFKKEQVNERVTLYPTNSPSRLMRVWHAIKIGRGLQADIVTAQDPFETGLVGLFVARRMGARLHVQVHTDFLSSAYAGHSILNRARVLVARFVIHRADHVRVVSDRIKDSIQARYRPRAVISVLPIFVDVERFRHATAPAQLTARFAQYASRLLVVSRLEAEKNVALAISSFAQSAPPDACLIVVGNGRQRAVLETLAGTMHIMDRVFFEGAQDTAAYYKMSDLVLVPSTYEGYGLVIVEALAAGKPVLSTNVGIARQAGAIVAEPEHFSTALAEWFKNGPRSGTLRDYPYYNYDEYVRAYSDDIAAAAR